MLSINPDGTIFNIPPGRLRVVLIERRFVEIRTHFVLQNKTGEAGKTSFFFKFGILTEDSIFECLRIPIFKY